MSHLESALLFQIRACKLPEPEPQYYFAKPRRFHFDFAWPKEKLAVECEGGIWVQGRHTRGKGYESDCCKYNLATLLGWRVLRFTGAMIKSGEALTTIEQALKQQQAA